MRIIPEDLYEAEEKVDQLLEKLADPQLNHITKANLQQQIKDAHARVQALRKQYYG